MKNRLQNSRLPSDAGNYTLCAVVEKGQICSVKKIVQTDDVFGLVPDVESLDYILYPSTRY
jgi:hypothetical protein